MAKSWRSIKGKDGVSARQEAWVELQSRLFIWLHYGKLCCLQEQYSMMWCWEVWCMVSNRSSSCCVVISQVFFCLKSPKFFWWTPDFIETCQALSSCLLHFHSASSVPDLFPILWISLCIFCFLKCSPWKAKLQWFFFYLREPPQALWNHVVFCTVIFCPIKCHLSWLLYRQPEQAGRAVPGRAVLSVIDMKQQNRRPSSSM